MSGPEVDVYVTQYTRGKNHNHIPQPLHWEICVLLDDSDGMPRGNIYHVIGSTAEYGFKKHENLHFTTAGGWRGSLKVGTIPRHALPKVEDLFAQVQVFSNDLQWGCRRWVFAALRKLRAQGYNIRPFWTWDELSNQMNMLLEEWEAGDI
ncbi:hypothetical protein AcW1_007014 [Taiwanofungus camphoratus]|nr:hypothetical protein AcV5_002817 [Antrodia cinnamomea]KAI0925073.1 hypothetical protein AcW2_005768 [Antrodia cinnamomea]KAI0929711.1 hypothetical protein AcV7_005180 [Antrodia cinnamomea]KAI0955422.1 hypothetical protein AcW1_007014 [Antrodia cinnamomea]